MGAPLENIIDFTLTYNQYKRQLFNYTLKMVNDRLTCEDIIQNVFLKLFENLKRIRNSESIQFWLFSTVRNEVYSYYRRKKVRLDQFGAEDSDEIEIDSGERLALTIEQNEMRELVNKELNRIPIEQRELFILREYGGLSYKEIADVMNIDEELVKSRLFKTRQKLIKRLSKIVTE
ncbi:MAG: sigma-70 family RNA polymerase sigma factor [Melioribacteraceae bacterium]|nr:sigma-70 family RNA polymerase sigma factor [Melioribacteraceae bacterium]